MATITDIPLPKHKREVIDHAIIRFAGDSGDGMQITGSQFTNTVALYGNDIATFPDYPAEIRAPAGTLPGVSGYQLHFSSSEVYTPGDAGKRAGGSANLRSEEHTPELPPPAPIPSPPLLENRK